MTSIQSSQQLDFRLATDTEEDALEFCALSNSLYARKVNPDYYSWQFFRTPFPSLLNLAVNEENKIVGTICLHIQQTGPGAETIAWVLDIMVSPAIQRQGIFRRLTDYSVSNLKPFNPAAVCVMANEKADGACVNGLGWNRINVFQTYFCGSGNTKSSEKFILEYDQIENFAECAEIIEATKDGMRGIDGSRLWTNLRSVEFLNWRFAENPRYSYNCFVAQKGGVPFGYLVLKVFQDPMTGQSFGDIVDIFWTEPDAEALADMLRFALKSFVEKGVGQVAMWLQTNTVLDETGQQCGFVRSEQKRFFCGKVLKREHNSLKDSSSWFINMSDSEVY